LVSRELDIRWDGLLPSNLIADVKLMALAECRRLSSVPVFLDDGPTVLMDDPWSFENIQRIVECLGCLPELVWSTRSRVFALIDQAAAAAGAGQGPEGWGPEINSNATGVVNESLVPHAHGDQSLTCRSISPESIEQSPSNIVRFVDFRILEAWREGASDIHFETTRDGLQVKLRVDGVLLAATGLEGKGAGEESINRIKVLAQLDISETRIPQDGRFRAAVMGREMDFRVSLMPSVHGEDAVIRLLDKANLRSGEQTISLRRLGFEQQSLERIRTLAREPHGMLLVTGPTGSGKTTTLYAVLSELNRGDEKIITIEDPVEYELPGVLQIPVNEKKGLTFARGLRSILRHDPDKILVGEIRDPETAEIAVQAALTGHLVFTTVHANNVYDVVGRFLHMNVDLYGFVSALNAIVAQRLIRLVCQHCAEAGELNTCVRDLEAVGIDRSAIQPKRGEGCTRCRGTGFSGRTVVAEVVPVDHGLRELILQKAPGLQLREYVGRLGIKPLRTAALELVASGQTTIEEVSRVVGSND